MVDEDSHQMSCLSPLLLIHRSKSEEPGGWLLARSQAGPEGKSTGAVERVMDGLLELGLGMDPDVVLARRSPSAVW